MLPKVPPWRGRGFLGGVNLSQTFKNFRAVKFIFLNKFVSDINKSIKPLLP